ncbi:MAG TPA: DNA primase [Chthoniobacterales bacterium]
MGTIPSQTIEQVAAANDIVEVIGSYFPLKRAGANFKALCPFHQEKTPSFHVSPQRQTFHCFGCGVGGSVFRFVMDYEHLDFPAAVHKLAARVGIPVVEERTQGGEEDCQHEARRTLLQLHAEAAEWFQQNLMKREVGAAARDYLKQRGIDSAKAKNWQLGYAPAEWDAFLKWALSRGYDRREILLSGLARPRDESNPGTELYDRFRDRIMFPICSYKTGEVIAFSGRVLVSEGDTAKYLNSPETPLFRKGDVLFGLHKSKRALIDADCAIVCEGQLDLITLFEAGITNVVAPQGTAFTEGQARILKRFVSEVVLCFDADAAGKKAAERSLEALLQNDLIVRVVEMPPGEDPDSLVRKKGKDDFEARVAAARDFFDFWIEREAASTDLSSLGAKMELARNLAQTVAHVHDTFLRGEIVRKVTARLGVSASDFESVLPKNERRGSFQQAQRAPEPVDIPRHDIAMLCLIALRDEAARNFLLGENWHEVLAQTPNSQLLVRILEADIRPDDPASLSSFMASLPPSEESLVAGWLVKKLPADASRVVEEWWRGLRQAVLRRQLEAAESRMKLPQLSTGEEVILQKQIVDLREQLHEVSQFSPAPAQ